MDLWDLFFELPKLFPKLRSARDFSKSSFWMMSSESEACRRALYVTRDLASEFDPSRKEHVAVVADLCCLFMFSLSRQIGTIFSAYLHPDSRETLSKALLMSLYGGRDAYDHRNELVKRISKDKEYAQSLSLPEWERLIKLSRQMLDAPIECLYTPLVLREVAFQALAGINAYDYLVTLATSHSQAVRFVILGIDYIVRACKLPPEFTEIIERPLHAALASKLQKMAP